MTMKKSINIGIIGDYDEKKTSHPATMAAIKHASKYLAVETTVAWLPTPWFLTGKSLERLGQLDAMWASSGSPYASMEGAIEGIRLARETGRPFIGT
jgi:CTP synthase (UTP-ammonia lyase)